MSASVFRHPSRAALSHAGLLWLPLAATVLASKVHKVLRLGGDGFVDFGATVAQDVVLLTILLLALVTIFDRARGRSLRAFEIATHVVVPVLMCAAVFDHVFFLTTGSLLDGSYAATRLQSIGQDLEVIQSIVTFGSALALVAPFVWSALVFWRYRARSTWARATFGGRRARFGIAATTAAVCVAIPLSFMTPSPDVMQTQPNFLVGFVSSALGEDDAPRFGKRSGRPLPEGPATLRGDGNQRAKNALLIVLESTGANRTSVYPPFEKTTPALAALAKRGAVVERAYTSVPHTTKALVSVHCGIYPNMSPGTEEAKFGAIPATCLARLLRDQGFSTAYFQSAEENYERRGDLVKGFGFETFRGKESLDGTGFDEASYFGWEDDVLVQPVLDWVDAQQAQDKRWFGALLTLTAHHPYAVPRGFERTKYDDNKAKDDYLNSVRYVDRTLEKLVAGLDARGALDDTLLIIVGDHGEGFGEHRRFQHDAVIYEEGIHVPMVLAGAGVDPETRIGGLRQNIDIVPTFVDALGFQPKGRFEGKSLLSTSGHDEVVVSCHYRNYCMASLSGASKTIYHYKKAAPEIFDIDADPLEKNNLIGENPGRRKEVDDVIAHLLDVKARNNKRYRLRTGNRVERYVTKRKPNFDDVPHYKPLGVELDAHTRILGVSVNPPEIEAGDQVELVTFYEVMRAPGSSWRTFHHVSGPQNIRGDHTPVEGAYPVHKWKTGDIVEDRFVISTRPDTLTGRYQMWTGMWKKGGKGTRAKARVEGKPVSKDDRIRLPDFVITKPKVDPANFVFASRPPLLDDATSGLTLVNATFGDVVRIHAIGIDKPEIKGGLKTTLTYVFEVLRPVGDAKFFVDFDGKTNVKRLKHVPVSGTYPVSAWKAGEFIVDHHEIITHTRHRDGTYRVLLGLEKQGALIPATAAERDVDDNRVHVGSYRLRD